MRCVDSMLSIPEQQYSTVVFRYLEVDMSTSPMCMINHTNNPASIPESSSDIDPKQNRTVQACPKKPHETRSQIRKPSPCRRWRNAADRTEQSQPTNAAPPFTSALWLESNHDLIFFLHFMVGHVWRRDYLGESRRFKGFKGHP